MQHTDNRELSMLCRRGGFGGAGADRHYPPDLELEPVHLEIHATLDLEEQSAALKVITSLVANRSGATTLALDGIGFEDLQVASSGPETPSSPSLRYDGRKIHLVWATPALRGEARTVTLTYRVKKPLSGLLFSKPTDSYPDKATYAATDHETELARYWLACIDLPSVRTTLDVHITARSSLTILANGLLVEEKAQKGGLKTAHWRLQQRCPSYLVCFAVGDFVRFDDAAVGPIPVAYFSSRTFTPVDLHRSFGATRAMLAWITQKLGLAFPFPKYYQFALPGFGGAMENISLVSWDDRYVCTDRHAGEGQWLTDQINIHEMAHAYFGDLVVCRDFAHAWLKESWATYIETCWLEEQKGADEQRYDLFTNAQNYFEEADHSYKRPLVTRQFTSSWQMYDRHLYPGGACRLHTLRCELGDEAFWAGVRDYLATFQGQVVETDDFRRIMEKHSGRSLQKFFDQWIYTPSYPDVKVSFHFDDEKNLGEFTVEQQQVNAKRGVPPFEFVTDLGWTIDGQSATKEVQVTAQRQTFQIPMPKNPEQVRFDPLGRVLHKLTFDPGTTKLRQQVAKAQDVVGRIEAARVLAGSGVAANVEAVARAYQTEPFWGVRREMVKAIANSQSGAALQALGAIIRAEKDPMVMTAVFSAAGSMRDSSIANALVERLKTNDLPPGASTTALEALGKQREAAPLDLLKAAAKRSEPHYGMEQAAALTALGHTHRLEALPLLLEACRYGATPYRARHGAVRGLAHLAPHAERGARQVAEERLADLLRDPDPKLCHAAAEALGKLHAKEAVPALTAFRERLPLQEQVAIDQIIKNLRRGDGGKKALEKQVEELEGKLRKMEERLRSLEALTRTAE